MLFRSRWARIRSVRDAVNKEIEAVRTSGAVGSSLQATVVVSVPAAERELLASLGEDLKFVLITSAAAVESGETLTVKVTPSPATKCERCWHWRSDVGADAAQAGLCGRCVSNLYGAGESRHVA